MLRRRQQHLLSEDQSRVGPRKWSGLAAHDFTASHEHFQVHQHHEGFVAEDVAMAQEDAVSLEIGSASFWEGMPAIAIPKHALNQTL